MRRVLYRTPTFTAHGLTWGYGTLLVRFASETASELPLNEFERALCLISLVRAPRHPTDKAKGLRKAIAAWNEGDGCLAHIRLAHLGLEAVETAEAAHALYLAAALLDSGIAPRTLARSVGCELPPLTLAGDDMLAKYDPDQPRNPAGSGAESGRWTKGPVAAGGTAAAAAARALAPAAPSLAEGLGAEALAWLTRIAGRLALPASLFGVAFVPSPNAGTAEEGTVTDRPGLRYRIDHDTGTLRLFNETDGVAAHALVAQLGADGVYRDVDTRVAIARALGQDAVLIDLDRAPATDATERDDEPKLCPAPQPDRPGGRKLFDDMYEQYVRDTVNPQLPPGLTFALPGDVPTGWVHYDDCRENDGDDRGQGQLRGLRCLIVRQE